MTTLVVKVIRLREVKGLSPTQLASLVPMHKSYLSGIENGKRKVENIGRRKLQGLAGALDIGIDYLVDDSLDETRSWEKVAADESLQLFLKKRSDISEEERAGLRGVSFNEDAPRTLKEWEQLLNRIRAFFRSKYTTGESRNRRRSRKDVNLGGSLGNLPKSS
jgi:transcriptional regulator with XRE-family HTH domain